MHLKKLLCLAFYLAISIFSVQAKTDSSRVFYYSFMDGRTQDLKEVRNIDYSKKVKLCEGQILNLKSPEIMANSAFKWSGPQNFNSSSPEIILENVSSQKEGIYVLEISDGINHKRVIYEVEISPKPEINFKTKSNSEYIKIQANVSNKNVKSWWTDAKNSPILNGNEIILKKSDLIEKGVFLVVNNGYCENKMEIRLNF